MRKIIQVMTIIGLGVGAARATEVPAGLSVRPGATQHTGTMYISLAYRIDNASSRAYSAVSILCALLDADGLPLVTEHGLVENLPAQGAGFGTVNFLFDQKKTWSSIACNITGAR